MENMLWTQGHDNIGMICSEEGVFKGGQEGYSRLNKEFTKWFVVKRWDYDDKSLRLYSDKNKVIISSFFSEVDSSGRNVTFAYLGDRSSLETSLKEFSQKMGYTIPADCFTTIFREIQKKARKTRRLRNISVVSLFLIIILGIICLSNR